MTCTLYSMNWFQRFVCCWLSILLLNTFFQTLTLGSSDNGHRVAKSDFKSFKKCEHNYAFRGEILNSTVRSVRSEIECASQCLGNSLCAAYNLIQLSNARFSLKSCEILSNSATNCKDLQETPLSKYKFCKFIFFFTLYFKNIETFSFIFLAICSFVLIIRIHALRIS